jgi:hypothetical protein
MTEDASKVRTIAGLIVTIGVTSALIAFYYNNLISFVDQSMLSLKSGGVTSSVSTFLLNVGKNSFLFQTNNNNNNNSTKILKVVQTETQRTQEPFIKDTFTLGEQGSKIFQFQTIKAASARIIGTAKVEGPGYVKIAENGGKCLSCDIKIIRGLEPNGLDAAAPTANSKIDFDIIPNTEQTLVVTNMSSDVRQNVTLDLQIIYENVIER